MDRIDLVLFVRNRCRIFLDQVFLEKMMKLALEKHGIKGKVEISLLVCGPKLAQKFNKEYRKMRYIPQVLGFPMSKKVDADGWVRLGDILICYQKLKKEALMMKKTEGQIWEEWIEHGVQNLLK